MALKDREQKEAFFKELPALLSGLVLPRPVREGKLLRLVGEAIEKHGAPASAISVVLSIVKHMDDAMVKAKVMPTMVRLFALPDRYETKRHDGFHPSGFLIMMILLRFLKITLTLSQ